MSEIQIKALDGASLKAHIAFPSCSNGSGLILVHGVFGLTDSLRALCDEFAACGYITVCPDLFSRQKNGAALESLPGNDGLPAVQVYKNFDIEAGLRDLLATLAHLRQIPGCGGKAGVLGFDFGGRLAFLLAARSDVSCAVGYDNTSLDSALGETNDINVPVLLHFGEHDVLMPEATRQKILSKIKTNPNITAYTYANAGHAFSQKDGQKFHSESAALAAQRTNDFIAEQLNK